MSICHPLLQGVFGSINGLNLPCQVSSNIEMENATYNGWLHSHFISLVIVFSSKGGRLPKHTHQILTAQVGEIVGCHTKCPGSWHNLHVAEGIYEKLELETPDGYCTVPSSQVTIELLERYSAHSRPTRSFLKIMLNKNINSNSHDQYHPIIKLPSGGCRSYRAALGDFKYP